jgi:hypothetical protein
MARYGEMTVPLLDTYASSQTLDQLILQSMIWMIMTWTCIHDIIDLDVEVAIVCHTRRWIADNLNSYPGLACIKVDDVGAVKSAYIGTCWSASIAPA